MGLESYAIYLSMNGEEDALDDRSHTFQNYPDAKDPTALRFARPERNELLSRTRRRCTGDPTNLRHLLPKTNPRERLKDGAVADLLLALVPNSEAKKRRKIVHGRTKDRPSPTYHRAMGAAAPPPARRAGAAITSLSSLPVLMPSCQGGNE